MFPTVAFVVGFTQQWTFKAMTPYTESQVQSNYQYNSSSNLGLVSDLEAEPFHQILDLAAC